LKKQIVFMAGLLVMFTVPSGADAQGIVGGADIGAARGRRAAGPVGGVVGGIVGGVVGGAVGGARGVLGLPRRNYHGSHRHNRRHY